MDKQPEEKPVPKKSVVKGKTVAKKKTKARVLADNLIANEMSDIKDHVIFDIFIPSLRDFIHEASVTVIDMILYGRDGQRGGIRKPRNTRSSYSYNQPAGYYNRYNYSQPAQQRPVRVEANNSSRFRDLMYIEYELVDDANYVIHQLNETISEYGMVSLSDYYEFSEIPSTWADREWGWYDVSMARVKPKNGKWVITNLPRPIYLNKN